MMEQDPTPLPHFLRRCNKFPRSVVNREGTVYMSKLCHNPTTKHRQYQYHWNWGHAFELSVSLNKLLKTRYAAEVLLRFLQEYYNGDGEDALVEDEDEDGEEQEHGNERVDIDKVIWMSNDVFIIWVSSRSSGDFFNTRYHRHGASAIHSINFEWCADSSDTLWICQQPSIATGEQAAVRSDVSSSTPLVKVMDTLLRLLARVETIDYLNLNTIPINGRRDSGATDLFPASLNALKAFVGKAKSERYLCFQQAGLSMEQWHAVASNCHPNVTIAIDYSCEIEGFAATEPRVLHHCPRKMYACCPDRAPPDERQVILAVVASTTSLEELEIVVSFERDKEVLLSWIGAISRNRSLQKLELALELERELDFDMTLGEWEFFCGAIASHPTLQEVEVRHANTKKFPTSPEKDRILLQKIFENTILREFDMQGNFLCNERSFDEAVNPVLEFNGFRKKVQAIKQESDIMKKQILFTAILLSAKVRRRPHHRFLLFKQNIDLLEQYSIEGKLSSDWNKTMRHLESLQEMMQARGMAIPYRLTKEDESSQHGRSRKRSRSSAVQPTP